MQLLSGTSGYSYPAWKGHFYPDDLKNADMLRYYGTRLGAVEINNTFYRMPREHVLEAWADAVPDGFRFAIKAPRRITHFRRLNNADEIVEDLVSAAAALGPHGGAILYQLPPNFKRDDDRLAAFVEMLPNPGTSAFEFRHATWFEEPIYEILRGRGCALVISDTDDGIEAPVVETAPWTYLRLRRSDYTNAELTRWSARIRGSGWKTVFAFFKHEEAGRGPALAEALGEMIGC